MLSHPPRISHTPIKHGPNVELTMVSLVSGVFNMNGGRDDL